MKTKRTKKKLSFPARVAIVSTFVGAMFTGYYSRIRTAYGGTLTEDPLNPGVWTGSGAAGADTTQSPTPAAGGALSVTTNAGFGIDTTTNGGAALDLDNGAADTSITFTDNNSSIITGASEGIDADNGGTGGMTITTTGTVTGTASDGINAYACGFVSSPTYMTIDVANVTGGVDGIDANNRGTGDLSVTVSGAVSGGTGYGIRTRTPTGNTTNITLNSGASVTGGSGAIYNDGGNSTTIVNTGASVTGNVNMGTGTDVFNLAGGTFYGAGGGTGVFGIIANDVTNSGIITMQDGAAGDVLTVTGDYTGTGTLKIDTVLDDGTVDTTDKLKVTGVTNAGTTTVNVNNAGGTGALTGSGPTDGIKVIEVTGTSTGSFAVANGGVGGGAYLYNLYKADGQNWYLQSLGLLPQTAGYRILAPIFTYMNSLHGRVGHREDRNGVVGKRDYKGMDGWIRVIGNTRDISPDGHASFRDNRYYTQAGIDREIIRNGYGRWMVGVNGLIGRSEVRVDGVDEKRVASIDSDFYGFGVTSTWYGDKGFYADLVAQNTLYTADFHSTRIREHQIDGENIVFSGEFGQRIHLWKSWGNTSVVPHAEFTWSRSTFDPFTDSDGVRVSMDNSQNHTLTGKFGLMLERRSAPEKPVKVVGFVASNFYANLDGDKTAINASGTNLDFPEQDAWLEVSGGGTVKIRDAVDFYAQGAAKTSMDDFGDSYSAEATFGFRISF